MDSNLYKCVYFICSVRVCTIASFQSQQIHTRAHTHTQVCAGYCNLSVDLRWQDRSLHSSTGECTEHSIHLRLSGSGRPAFFTLPVHDAFGTLEECHWPECPDLSWGPGCHTTLYTVTHTHTRGHTDTHRHTQGHTDTYCMLRVAC